MYRRCEEKCEETQYGFKQGMGTTLFVMIRM